MLMRDCRAGKAVKEIETAVEVINQS